jgi:hypothetical protein
LAVWQEVEVRRHLILDIYPASCYCILFRPRHFSCTLFLNILSLCSSPNIRHKISHPYKMRNKIIKSEYCDLFEFRQERWRQKVLMCWSLWSL